jgi:O-antigen/teichoic acid export membrane protein
VALMTLPAGAGIALVARPMMLLVFGARWDAAVPLVQLFACVGVFQVGTSISAVLLMAEGVPHIGFRIEFVLTVLRLIALLVLVPSFGLVGAASGVAATGFIGEVIYLVVTSRRTGLHARDLALNLWRPALATGAMALVLLATGLAQRPPGEGAVWSGLLLAAAVSIGALVFGAVLSVAWLACGRPRGAETYILSMAGQTIRHWLGR